MAVRLARGALYTRRQIHEMVGGGSTQSFLPGRDGRVRAGCFDITVNAEAPLKVDFGQGPKVVQEVRNLATHPYPIPVFMKLRPDHWRYEGMYRPVRISDRPEDLAGLREDAIGVIFFEPAREDETITDLRPLDLPPLHGERAYGQIPGVAIGQQFATREELHRAGVHRPLQAGICGSTTEGAESIVVSGGYEDDQDLGDVIIYTGQGGNDPNSGKQVDHQKLERGNLALARSETTGHPVRVIRGAHRGSPHAPPSGYRYDGLFRVVQHWVETGRSGFRVWRFRLERLLPEQVDPGPTTTNGSTGPAPRTKATVLRIVRSTALADEVKRLHDFRCQVCGERLAGELTAGPYAEGAHIRPLGTPHDGPDALSNLLCLCPNHHVLFDMWGFSIADDGKLLGVPGILRTDLRHSLDKSHLAYHRQHYELARASGSPAEPPQRSKGKRVTS
jgi:putative restriction endonuclease